MNGDILFVTLHIKDCRRCEIEVDKKLTYVKVRVDHKTTKYDLFAEGEEEISFFVGNNDVSIQIGDERTTVLIEINEKEVAEVDLIKNKVLYFENYIADKAKLSHHDIVFCGANEKKVFTYYPDLIKKILVNPTPKQTELMKTLDSYVKFNNEIKTSTLSEHILFLDFVQGHRYGIDVDMLPLIKRMAAYYDVEKLFHFI